MDTIARIFDGLLSRYQSRVPDVPRVVSAMIEAGLLANAGELVNDHVAFRTLGVRHLGIASLERIFLHHGYTKRDAYNFPEKKLNAYWYAPPRPELPRIFISELRVQELSEAAQHILHGYTDEVRRDPVETLDLDDAAAVDAFLHSPLWRTPTWADYQKLRDESEFAAWTIYNRYYLNHFTISVHELPEPYSNLGVFNDFLLARGFLLNNAGGLIKTSGDGKLLQSSTVARAIAADFADGDTHEIAGSYVEFAERRPLDAWAHLSRHDLRREHRREGFEAKNADRIFESTFTSQTGRTG